MGTLKGALATVNREDMADVQAHKLGQARGMHDAAAIYTYLFIHACIHPPTRRKRHRLLD